MMNPKQLVKLTNTVGIVSFVLLIYWIFVFILVQVFNLKIFRQHLSEIFALSITGIIALMAGALMLNIMFNLTRIAERGSETDSPKKGKKIILLMIFMFPVLAGVLFAGNHLSLQRREQALQQAGQALVQQNVRGIQAAAQYRFTPEYIRQTSDYLKVVEQANTSFQRAVIIVPDEVDGNRVYLRIASDSGASDAVKNVASEAASPLDKRNFLYRAETFEHDYLRNTFAQHLTQPYFAQRENNYFLYLPQQHNGKTTAILLLTDYYPYGKFGS